MSLSKSTFCEIEKGFNATTAHLWTHRRDLAKLVRDAHVRSVLDMTERGGAAIIVTELSGTSIAPEQLQALMKHEQVRDVAERLLREGRYFAHLAPKELLSLVREEGRDRTSNSRAIAPWLWILGDKRYVCYAVVAKKHE